MRYVTLRISREGPELALADPEGLGGVAGAEGDWEDAII
jgi:hypothetical protein